MTTQAEDDETSETPAPHGTEVALPAPSLLIAARGFAKIIPIVLGLFVFGFALARGIDPTTAGIRAVLALAASGVVSWLAVSFLAQSILTVLGGLKPQPAPAPATSTQSWEA